MIHPDSSTPWSEADVPPPPSAATEIRQALIGFVAESWWLMSLAAAVFLTVALFSYSEYDSALSSTGLDWVVRNRAGWLGAWAADVLRFCYGRASWLVVVLALMLTYWGYQRAWHFGRERSFTSMVVGFQLWLLATAAWEALRFGFESGGVMGWVMMETLSHLGFVATSALVSLAWLLSLSWFLGFSWLVLFERLGHSLVQLWYRRGRREVPVRAPVEGFASAHEPEPLALWDNAVAAETASGFRFGAETDPALASIAPAAGDETASDELEVFDQKLQSWSEQVQARPLSMAAEDDDDEPLEHTQAASAPPAPALAPQAHSAAPINSSFAPAVLPGLNLLEPPKPRPATEEQLLQQLAQKIEDTLKEFNVSVKVVAYEPGPVVTRFEIAPAIGVKGSQIVNLARDVARALSLASIRVLETLPGKDTMALELPNRQRQTVSLRELLASEAYQSSGSLLSVALGADVGGRPVVADLAKMPHLLVAGTTGSGKSVGINTMIVSLLYRADPKAVRLILIDPKMLELSVYADIPHLLAPVVTDMKQAHFALGWCVGEMDRRYRLMSALGVRNLAGYNQKVAQAQAQGQGLLDPLDNEAPALEHMSFVVVVVDELADLMMVVGKKIEEQIARLAQKARAAGIHLILATQRPSVDVITGLIKANVPTRIAFQVSSKIDSRTILDQMGAEALLGMGDMLYLPPGSGFPLRIHGAFVSDDEVHRVAEHCRSMGPPRYVEGILEDPEALMNAMSEETGGGEMDPLYDEAVAQVLKSQRVSVSLVQRALRVGYNRAARIVDDMERAGLVGPQQSNGMRELLVPQRDNG